MQGVILVCFCLVHGLYLIFPQGRVGSKGGGGGVVGILSGLTQSLLLTQMKFESQVQFNSKIVLVLLRVYLLVVKLVNQFNI